jgi:hypothetical protein
VSIPANVKSIGIIIFYDCINLEKIIIDKNNEVYDSRENCNAIIETDINKLIVGCQNTIIPSSVTSIGKSAFIGCQNLKSVIISKELKSVGESAFENSGLETVYYTGTSSEWKKLTGLSKNKFNSATTYFYKETKPATLGYYWHYDTDGVIPVIW